MTNKQLDLCICEIATGNREALRQLYDEFKNPIFCLICQFSKTIRQQKMLSKILF